MGGGSVASWVVDGGSDGDGVCEGLVGGLVVDGDWVVDGGEVGGWVVDGGEVGGLVMD